MRQGGHLRPHILDHVEYSWSILGRRNVSAAGSVPTRTLLLHNVEMVVLHATYAFDTIYQPGMIHTGSSRRCVSYETIIKSDRLDLKASDVLLMPRVEDFIAPIIEREIELRLSLNEDSTTPVHLQVERQVFGSGITHFLHLTIMLGITVRDSTRRI
jgi:hypothetical protein